MRSHSFFNQSKPANIAGTIVLVNKQTQKLHRISHEKHCALVGKKSEVKPKPHVGGLLSFILFGYAK